MRYIKKYEELITLDLDYDDKTELIIHALDNNKIELLKSLIIDGNINPNDKELSLLSKACDLEDFEMIKVLISVGADVNIMVKSYYYETPLINTIILQIKSNTNKTNLIKLLEIFFDAKVNLFQQDTAKSYSQHWKQNNFFDELEKKLNANYLTKGFVNKVMQMIKTKLPDQYERYYMEKDAEKYNL
jgi:ankyrin repeat protein